MLTLDFTLQLKCEIRAQHGKFQALHQRAIIGSSETGNDMWCDRHKIWWIFQQEDITMWRPFMNTYNCCNIYLFVQLRWQVLSKFSWFLQQKGGGHLCLCRCDHLVGASTQLSWDWLFVCVHACSTFAHVHRFPFGGKIIIIIIIISILRIDNQDDVKYVI